MGKIIINVDWLPNNYAAAPENSEIACVVTAKSLDELKKEMEEAQDLYDQLLEEKAEKDKAKLFEAYKKSKRSLDEIVDFMKGKADL